MSVEQASIEKNKAEKSKTEKNKAVALRYAKEGWGSQPDWKGVWDEIVAPDVVYHFNSFPEPIVGLEANKNFNEGLFQGFSDIYQSLEDILAEGDKVVYRTTITGTHTGEFLGMPPTGKSIRMNDFTLLKISSGQIVEMWYDCNLLAMLGQLGLASDLAA